MIKPEKDKLTRAHAVSPVLEQGRVFIPLVAPWIEDLRLELIQFPDGKHDDQVDSITQFLGYAERKRMRGPTAVRIPMFAGKYKNR
jgi:predicted phage terminase large subunit-like protein